MDELTVKTYEQCATAYAAQRKASDPAHAEAFARALPVGALRLDLGCGSGQYLPWLGSPVVAADASPAMVEHARRSPLPGGPPLPVVCDLEALPFRRGAFAGIWASKCLQHIPAERLPMALAGLHRAVELGGLVDITLFTDAAAGPGVSGTDFADDEFPGRWFTWWQPEVVSRLLVGAGFALESLEPGGPSGRARSTVTARRIRSLPDTVGPDMRLLVCGLNPSVYAADAGVGFARPGNRFWPAARAAGLVAVDRDPDGALRQHGIGMTDLVKRATVAAAELTTEEYRAGLARVEALVRWLKPGAVCFVGLAGWRAAVDRRAEPGLQPAGLAGVPAYVMPSTSGLNARVPLAALATHLRAAADLADGSR